MYPKKLPFTLPAKHTTDEERERTTTPIPKKVLESQQNLEETTELYKSLRTATMITDDTKRMERVNERLKSVTVWGVEILKYRERSVSKN